jgi:hypothetical protein
VLEPATQLGGFVDVPDGAVELTVDEIETELVFNDTVGELDKEVVFPIPTPRLVETVGDTVDIMDVDVDEGPATCENTRRELICQ